MRCDGGSRVRAGSASRAAVLRAPRCRIARLTDVLYTSGLAADSLEEWTATLASGASDLVSTDVIESEASSISSSFPS